MHYSFMGAGLAPTAFEVGAIQVAALLKRDQVDAVFLTPGLTQLYARRERARVTTSNGKGS